MVKNFRDLEGLRNTFHTISLIIRQKYNEAFEAYELANAKENTDGKYKQKIQSLKDSINNVNSSIREYRRLEELINLGGVQVTYNDPIAELSNKVSNYNNELNTIDESIQREVEKINNAEFIYSNSGITSSEIESIYRISDAAINNTYELNNLIREFINGKAANLKSFGFIDDNGNITDAPKVSPKYIGTSAFRSCEGLEEILLPGNTFSDVCIDTYAFDSCTGLKSACLPVVADRLSDSAFKNDAELSELHFSRDIVKGEAYVELNMRSVGDSAFSGCSSITEVRLLENCRSIESSAFSDCSKLSEVKWNENRVENGNVVGYASFTRTGLEKVELPGSYVSVDAFAFAECPNLKSFALHRTGGNKVEQSVDLQGADSCEALSEVFIPITSEVYNIPFTDDDGVAIYTDSEMVKEYAANNNLNIREWNE